MRVGWEGWGTYARSQDDALDPQSDEGEERPEGEVDVGVVRAGLLDHAAELGVAVGADHGEDAAGHPDHQAHVDAARALEHAGGRDEDAAADDAADDDLGGGGEEAPTVHPLRRVISAFSPTPPSSLSSSSSSFSSVSLHKAKLDKCSFLRRIIPHHPQQFPSRLPPTCPG